MIAADDPLAALQRLATAWRRALGCPVVGITGLGGEDLDQGHPRGHAEPAPAHRGQPREPQHRDRAAHDRARGARRDRGARPRDGDARSGADRRADRHRRARRRAHHGRGPGAPRADGLDRGDRRGQGRARRRSAPRRDGDRPRRRDAARRPSPRRRHHRHLRTGRRCGCPSGRSAAGGVGDGWGGRISAHMRRNALAALAAARAVGVEPDGLLDVALSSFRGQRIELPGGIVVINDCYNANPMSMRAALDDLAASASGRRVAVLGDMLELGPDEDSLPRRDRRPRPRDRGRRARRGRAARRALRRRLRRGRSPCPTPRRPPRRSRTCWPRATPSCSRARAASASKWSPGRWKAPDGRGPHRRHGGAAHLHLPLAALHL